MQSKCSELLEFSLPSRGGILSVTLEQGGTLFVLGRNGTGKSALIHYMRNACGKIKESNIVYIPGSRPSYFDGDSLNMTANARVQFETNSANWDTSPDIRIRPIAGTSRNERAIFDLQTAEIEYRVQASYDVQCEGSSSPAIARLQSKNSPLDRVNRLLEQANLPIRTAISAGELRAERDGENYSISKMSDGERAALIIIADVISARPRSTFIIDEPELHLHRAIIVPLLSALVAERPDCRMIISTHELALANDHPASQILLVRGCTWQRQAPSSWDIDLLRNSDEIPDDLRIDLLGSRQTILFIEGISTSRDLPLYATLFPKISVKHRATCTEVHKAVTGLRQIESFHHTSAFGLVDNDSMSDEYKETLRKDFVFALPMFAVESLYYSSEVIRAVAERQGVTLSSNPDDLIDTARNSAFAILRQKGKIEHLAARVAERQMRDLVLKAMPTRDQMTSDDSIALSISVESPYPTSLARIKMLMESEDLDAIVAGYPIRESGILGNIAKSLHFIGDADYERAALAVVSSRPELANALRAKLGDLPNFLS